MPFDSRASFLNWTAVFQGGVVLIALFLAWLAGLWPLDAIHWNWPDFGWGIAAIAPMLLVLAGAPGLRKLVGDLLGPALSRCTWYDLILLAALAGFGEELLFRGVLEPWIGRWSTWAGILIANLIFGMLHAITPWYAVVATSFGLYLSWLNRGLGEPNLLRPIIAHAAYDYIAFLVIVRESRRQQLPETGPGPRSDSKPPPLLP